MTAGELEVALGRNNRWINSKINKGYKVYDIGINPMSPYRSPFYSLERSIIEQRGYPITQIPR